MRKYKNLGHDKELLPGLLLVAPGCSWLLLVAPGCPPAKFNRPLRGGRMRIARYAMIEIAQKSEGVPSQAAIPSLTTTPAA